MESLNTNKPHLIIMVGIPGSGKSFFAEHFADTFKAPIISFDQLRQKIFKSPTFDKKEDEIISRIANYMLFEILKTGRTVVYDGQTSLRADRSIIAKRTREAGYEPLFIWVQTELTIAKKRAIKNASLSNEQFDFRLKQFSAPHQTEKVVVISGKHAYTSQLKIVLKHLIEPRVKIEEKLELTHPTKNRNYLIR